MKRRRNASVQWRWEPSLKSIRIGFTLCVFLILLLTITVFTSIEVALEKTRLLENFHSERLLVLVICCAVSSLLGGLMSDLFIRLPMLPVKKLLKGLARLANGHFEERADFGDAPPMRELAEAFNTLASELENTEMLRTDFVNNFSHEFKTPIVSIRGFARLLQREDLSAEERREYVNIIVDESTRLSNMATNVLNLTKIENQSILTQTEEYNLSEQLRRCILLLEKKWEAKRLELNADFREFMVKGDQELLHQVWVNLLDNAIKFSPEAGLLSIQIHTDREWLRVAIGNQGPMIPEEQKKRIYDKFWQGDSSHAAEGTGIGLSIVKKVVELHGGTVSVDSTAQQTVFTVSLPYGHA